jgi:hypothetical protein
VCQADPGNPVHHIPIALRLRGPLDVDALRAAFVTMVRRHGALRTTFDEVDGEPVQRIADEPDVPFRVLDLAEGDEPERLHAAARLAHEDGQRGFDLRRGPLLRVQILRLGPDDHVLAWVTHHLVSDGWSTGRQLAELLTLHGALREGRPADLPALPASYADFARSQQARVASPAMDAERAYWRERLAGAPRLLDLPTDRPRSPHPGFALGTSPLRLPAPLARAASGLARRAGTTVYTVLLTAFALVAAEESGQDDILVTSPIAGRTRSAWEPLVGFFVNRVVLRIDCSGRPGFLELLARARRRAAEAYAHQDLPFDLLLDELGEDAPGLQLQVALNNYPVGDADPGGLSLAPVPDVTGRGFLPMLELYSPERSRFDLALTLGQLPDGIAGGLEYNARLFDPGRVAAFGDRLLEILAAAADREA